MPSVKKGGIKYHFSSLWYDSTWDGTHVSIGEHSNFYANVADVSFYCWLKITCELYNNMSNK